MRCVGGTLFIIVLVEFLNIKMKFSAVLSVSLTSLPPLSEYLLYIPHAAGIHVQSVMKESGESEKGLKQSCSNNWLLYIELYLVTF